MPLKKSQDWLNWMQEMYFKIKGTIRDIETIATGHGKKNLSRLNKIYGKANWRKLKGICHLELEDGLFGPYRYLE